VKSGKPKPEALVNAFLSVEKLHLLPYPKRIVYSFVVSLLFSSNLLRDAAVLVFLYDLCIAAIFSYIQF